MQKFVHCRRRVILNTVQKHSVIFPISNFLIATCCYEVFLRLKMSTNSVSRDTDRIQGGEESREEFWFKIFRSFFPKPENLISIILRNYNSQFLFKSLVVWIESMWLMAGTICWLL
jgi:hypothetical protein